MEIVEFNGWPGCVRLSDGRTETIITTDVGPRIMRFAYVGGRNILKEIPEEQGGTGESEWKIRGGHRLWISPELKPRTYEPDNSPVKKEEIAGGVRLKQDPGPLSGIAKTLEVTLLPGPGELRVNHVLTNMNQQAVEVAPWAISVLAAGGTAVIPLPEKIPHTVRLTHNQEWSIWPYTDLADGRWQFGSSFIRLVHDPGKGATKMGMAHREGWAGYALNEVFFLKRFERIEGGVYPDGGVNLEAFANRDFLELESLGSLESIEPGQSAGHSESWQLHELPTGIGPDCSEDEMRRALRSALE
jgi:hypothetical protein